MVVTNLGRSARSPDFHQGVVGENIRRIRRQRRFSQRKLAAYAGVSPSYIAYIEKGARSPSLTTLNRIARCLGVAPEVFFQEEAGVKDCDGNRLQELCRLLDPQEVTFIESVIEAYLRLRRR